MYKKLYSLVIGLLLFSISNTVNSQDLVIPRGCPTTSHAHQNSMDTNPEYRSFVENRMLQVSDYLSRQNPDCANGPIIIPIAVHFDQGIVPAGEEACMLNVVNEQITALNQDFAATNPDISNYDNFLGCLPASALGSPCIQFCLASANHPAGWGLADGDPAVTFGDSRWDWTTFYDLFNNDTNGDGIPDALSSPDWAGYMNVFVGDGDSFSFPGILGLSEGLPGDFSGTGVFVNACNFGSTTYGGTACGTAPSAGNCGNGNAVLTQFDRGRTLTHEIGHYLGLFHIWGDELVCSLGFPVDNPCDGSDQIADTPDMECSYQPTAAGQACPGTNCADSPATCDGVQDMWFNYMAYAGDACAWMFSSGQSDVMYANAALSGFTTNVPIQCTTVLCDTVMIACDDLDPCTENDMAGVDAVDNSIICVPCAGTPVAACALAPTMQACDDGDPCTENDMEGIDACDGVTVCIPCAGTNAAPCIQLPVSQPCDDGDPCTENDAEFIDACDGVTVCVPCAGTPVASCTLAPTMQACDDGDPCTENDMEGIDACDGTTVCVPCAGTPVASCTLTPTMQACDDGDPCTENDMEGIDACDGTTVCVPCAGTPIASCTLTPTMQACDDGDPCTENDMEGIDACDGTTVCVPCAGTAVASCTLAPTMQACDDGDPCTENDMEGIDACDGTTVCIPCAGTNATPCLGTPIMQACDDNDPCTENDMEGVDECDGVTVCVPCAGTAVASCTLIPTMQACDDGDPCTENDMEGIDACDGTTICVPCAGTPIASCTLTPTMQACDDGDPCTENDMEGIDACDGTTICIPCAGTAVASGCTDPDACNFDSAAICDDGNCDYTSCLCQLMIPMPYAGWHMISSYCNPDPDSITQVFAPIVNDIIQVKNLTGQVYVPSFNNFNTFTTWDITQGYLVKTANATTLPINGGYPVDLNIDQIPLYTGWNMIAYWLQGDADPIDVFSSIASDVIQVKDLNGAYVPSFNNFNNMGNMMETRGYQVKMNADNFLQYNPSNILPRPAPEFYSDEPLKTVHFTKEIKPNPNSATLIIMDDENNPLNRGDELGVFTKNGILVGAFVYENAMMGGLVFGDDETEDGIDGILADEAYIFKIWDKDLNEERVVEMNFIQGSNTYLKDDLCAVSFKTETVLGLNEITGLSIQLSPNPATEEINFSIELDQTTNLTIEIYQVDGQLIDVVGTQKFEQGLSLVNYKVNHLSNGLYIYRVTNNEKSYTERFTIAR